MISEKEVSVANQNEFQINSGNITINSSNVQLGSLSMNGSNFGVNSTTLKIGQLTTVDTGFSLTNSNITMLSGYFSNVTLISVASVININGNFTLSPTSLIIVDPDTQIIIKDCGDIQGNIHVDLSKFKADTKKSNFTLFSSSCLNQFDTSKITFINYAAYSDPCQKETLTPKYSGTGIEILVDYSPQTTCLINTIPTGTGTQGSGTNGGVVTGSKHNSGNYLFVSVVIMIIICLL